MNTTPPLHILAVGALAQKGDQYLLVRSPLRGWEFPGGQVENGEDLIEALKREVYEESGIRICHAKMVGMYSNISGERTKLMVDFVVDYESGECLTSEESLEVGWFSRDETLQKVQTSSYPYRLQKMLDFEGKIIHASYRTKPDFQVIQEYFL